MMVARPKVDGPSRWRMRLQRAYEALAKARVFLLAQGLARRPHRSAPFISART
jgi:hypothetical protein